MKIGVDLDETLSQTFDPCLGYMRERLNIPHLYEDLTMHNMWEIPGMPITKDQAIEIFSDFDTKHDPEHHLIFPVEGSTDIISWLKNNGHDLHIVTARGSNVDRLTRLWIDRHFREKFSDIHFTDQFRQKDHKKRQKGEVCLELGIELMIEDNLDYAEEIVRNGVEVILLERPWNRERQDIHPGIIRVKDWDGVRSYVEKKILSII